MRQAFHELKIATKGRGLYEFTGQVEQWISSQKFQNGLLTLHLRHTSASLLIQENADPDVRRDLEAFFSRLVPDGDRLFIHTAEGDDDMPAHVRTALTAVNFSLPLNAGELVLGTGREYIFGNIATRRTHAEWRCTFWGNKLAQVPA